MEPVLMYTDNGKYNEAISRHSIYLEDLTAILLAYNALNLGVINGQGFRALVYDPAGVVFDKMTNGQSVEINGFPVDRTKALELLVKPQGYETMEALVKAYKQKRNWDYYLGNVDVDIAGTEVVLKQSVIDAELEACKIYATTEKQKRVFEFAQGVIALAETKFGGANPDLQELVTLTINTRETLLGSRNFQYYINAQAIKEFDNRGRI